VSLQPGPLDFLIDAADLLAEPDPGPTPWLVEDLVVDRALVAAVGPPKATKTYGMLEVVVAVVSGRPAFGRFEVPEPGPVVYVIAESGRAALWRRLDSLSRGRAIPRGELRGLHLAPNVGVKLDDPDWQARLIDVGKAIKPRLFVFDPLARMKAPARNESAQNEMSAVIDFWGELREKTGAAVALVHHTGHQGTHMRGTSDLESAWETKLSWRRASGVVELKTEHREEEDGDPFEYRIDWDHDSRTIRLEPVEKDAPDDDLLDRVRAYRAKHPNASANEAYKALGGRKKRILEAFKNPRTNPAQSGSGNHREPPPAAASQVVPPGGLVRASGNHLEEPVPGTTLDEPEIERLAERAREGR
jgi:hypothetical protein